MSQGHTSCEPCFKEKQDLSSRTYSIEDAKLSFEKLGYQLISTEYQSSDKPLEYYCPTHDVTAYISYSRFLIGQTACTPCSVEKRKTTVMEKYGVEHNMHLQENKDKIKATCMERYGVDSPLKLEEVKEKRYATMTEKYGVKHPAQNEEIKEQMRLTNQERRGVDHPAQCPEVRKKTEDTNMERYGFKNPFENPEFALKRQETLMSNYGVVNPMQSETIKEKCRETSMENWGFPSPFQSDVIKEKCKASNLERYGVEYYAQHPDYEAKRKATCLKNYGVEYPSQSPEIKERARQTCLKRYGYEYAHQNPENFAKRQKLSYLRKEHKLPSGATIQCQGYEPQCYNDLIKEGISESELLAGVDSMPHIVYMYENKPCLYYPDIYLPTFNKLIEVKSEWTFKTDIDKLIEKLAEARKTYDIELRIYNKKGGRIVIKKALEKLHIMYRKMFRKTILAESITVLGLIADYLTPDSGHF